MYGDITLIVYAAFAGVGAAIGLLLALLAWTVAPLGWWTFALPIIGATTAVGWFYRQNH